MQFFLTVLDVVKSCDMFWHFFCTILCLDHFVRSKWWGDECKSLASRRLRSSMVSGGRPPMHTGAILGKTCSLNWLLWADYSCLNCLKLINKWSQFDESLNHLESVLEVGKIGHFCCPKASSFRTDALHSQERSIVPESSVGCLNGEQKPGMLERYSQHSHDLRGKTNDKIW